jgi:hypothetical protein
MIGGSHWRRLKYINIYQPIELHQWGLSSCQFFSILALSLASTSPFQNLPFRLTNQKLFDLRTWR